MQYIDDHMEDQFREAANGYPLKTDPGNWDEITGLVQDNNNATLAKPNHNSRKFGIGFIMSVFLLSNFSLNLLYKPTLNRTEINSQIFALEKIKNEKPNTSTSNKVVTEPIVSATPGKQAELIEADSDMPLIVTDKETSPEKELLNAESEISIVNTPQVVSRETVMTPVEKPNITADQHQKKTAEFGFYLGLNAGVQFSQVKNQGFSKPGFGGGFVAGYRFGKRFSAETGLQYSQKKYYSDGKYFDMSKASGGMPANMQVLSLEGKSDIFEIPLKIKYDFISNKKAAWFITTGLSYYLLTRESNDYLAIINGNKQHMEAQYFENKKYVFAALYFSAGHEITTTNKFKIRIEPYIQIPLKNIGIGSMPVMTAGLHVGILKNTK